MKNILCFGDSNTWGFDADNYNTETGIVKRMPFEIRWPGVAQNILGSNYRIIENALNGRTLMNEDPYSPHRLGIASLEETLDANAPLDMVIIMLGANELKTYFNLSAGMIRDGLEKLISAAKQRFYNYPEPKILVISPAPVRRNVDACIFGHIFGPEAYEKSCELSKHYDLAAKRHGCGFIDGASLNLSISEIDGLHYTREDHAKLGTQAAGKIREMLG
jgi:lysophospholipase L1-like esterase